MFDVRCSLPAIRAWKRKEINNLKIILKWTILFILDRNKHELWLYNFYVDFISEAIFPINQSLALVFYKMGQPRPLFHLFLVFSNKHFYNYYNKSIWKMSFPSGIWCRDLNPRPSEHEPPPITTRPGLPFVTISRWSKFWLLLKLRKSNKKILIKRGMNENLLFFFDMKITFQGKKILRQFSGD